MGTPLPAAESPTSVQPGGYGFFVRCELKWGHFRRAALRRFFPITLAYWRSRRQGVCSNCPHDILDPRDLKFVRNVCGYHFRPEDDHYAHRERLGFARYGYAELVGFSVILLGLASVCGWLAHAVSSIFVAPLFAVMTLWLFVVSFFRDPPRRVPTDADALVSPADGTVTHVETIDDPDLGRVLRVSIFLSIFNVHVNRAPRAGRVTAVRYFRGEYLDARHAECHVRNEQLWVDFQDAANGRPIRVKQISGAIARRIVCKLKAGDEVVAGERYGMIKFGSRTDVLLPAGIVKEVLVHVGDKVRGAKTMLMRLG
ncbi:MAG TPA: phosphatidylserine decarboxylase [Gemmataceae bacterium]|nr:phosphatidylserine decarboxylase [Gemmataceae bacterium]